MRSLARPDAETVALLGHDLRMAMSEVIGGLRQIDPDRLPADARAQIARTQVASEALAALLEHALALIHSDPQPSYHAAITTAQQHTAPRMDTAPQIEPAHFHELLQMAGPKMAAGLLDQLQKDLRAAERGLIAAAQGPDWLEMRRQSHVMIALAGTAGASLLHRQAQTLNALAHHPAPDHGAFHALLPQALEQLSELINFIDQQISFPPPIAPQEPQ